MAFFSLFFFSLFSVFFFSLFSFLPPPCLTQVFARLPSESMKQDQDGLWQKKILLAGTLRVCYCLLCCLFVFVCLFVFCFVLFLLLVLFACLFYLFIYLFILPPLSVIASTPPFLGQDLRPARKDFQRHSSLVRCWCARGICSILGGRFSGRGMYFVSQEEVGGE